MRILVCGSRHLGMYTPVETILNDYEITRIIEGGAKGADRQAKAYAMQKGIPFEEYPADWEKYGKAAGPIRNKQMLDEGKPNLVIAFLAPDSRGTKNMIEQATKAGVPVKVVDIGMV